MKIKLILSLLLLVASAANAQNTVVDDLLKEDSTGLGRMIYGAYGQITYGNPSSFNAGDYKYQGKGFELEAGGYIMLKAWQDFADLEIGGGYHFSDGPENRNLNGNEIGYGIKSPKLYASLAFQLPNKTAVAVGAYKEFGTSIETGSSYHDLDSSGGKGLFAEYQMYPDIINGQMAYLRLTVGDLPLDINNRDGSFSESPTYVGLSIGYKFRPKR